MLQQSQQNKIQVFLILWVALFFSSLMMVGVQAAQYGFSDFSISMDDFFRPDVLIFCVLGVVNFVMALLIPKLLRRLNPQFKNYPANEDLLLKLSFVPFVLRLAIAEAVTLFGFVAASTIEKTALMLPFVGATLTVFFLSFPSYSLFRSWFRRV